MSRSYVLDFLHSEPYPQLPTLMKHVDIVKHTARGIQDESPEAISAAILGKLRFAAQKLGEVSSGTDESDIIVL
jgi:hypothetical protein